MQQIIRLDPDDDMSTVRERLERAQSTSVALVLSPRSRVFQNLVNLKLVQRSAGQLSLHLTLVTTDARTGSLARSLGIPVRSGLGSGGRDAEQPESPSDAGPAEASAASRRPSRGGQRQDSPAWTWGVVLARVLGYALLVITIALVGVAVLLVLPEASVVVSPATETLTETIAVQASPEFKAVDVARGLVPARLVQVALEDSAQTTTTGRRQEPADKATGRVMFTNRSGAALVVPEGTVVRTSTGSSVRFRTTGVTTVEAGTFAHIPVVAELPGSVGNVPAWSITQVEGGLAFQMAVINDTPTAGGSEKQAQLVTAADRQRLRDSLVEKLKGSSLAAVQKELQAGDFLATSSLVVKVEDESFDREVGDVTGSLGARMRVSASALVVPRDRLAGLVEAFMQNKVPEAATAVPGSVKYTAPANVQLDGTTLTFRTQAQIATTARLSEGQIRLDVQGKAPDEARRILSQRYRLAAAPEIVLRNAVMDRLPFLAFRIQVRVVPGK